MLKLKGILVMRALDKAELYWLREQVIKREIFLKRITVLKRIKWCIMVCILIFKRSNSPSNKSMLFLKISEGYLHLLVYSNIYPSLRKYFLRFNANLLYPRSLFSLIFKLYVWKFHLEIMWHILCNKGKKWLVPKPELFYKMKWGLCLRRNTYFSQRKRL